MNQRGYTLIELAVAAGIAALLAAGAFSLAQSARALAMRSSVQQFDAALAYAQTLAAANGAAVDIEVRPRTGPGGSPVAGAVLAMPGLPPVALDADVREAKLGGPPFSLSLNAAGHAQCPSGETSVSLLLRDPRATARRTIPCNAPAAGPAVTIGSVPK